MAYKSCKMRAVAEILSCPVNASSRRGTEWPGSPFAAADPGEGPGGPSPPLPLFLDQTEKQTKPPYLKICRSGSGAHRSRGKSMAPASLSAGLTMIKLDKNFDTMESLS